MPSASGLCGFNWGSVMKTGLCFAFIALLWVSASPASAAEDIEKLAGTVPAEVSEVVSGGTWSKDGSYGVYRAMVLTTGGESAQQANVVVQLLSLEGKAAAPKIFKTVLVKEAADKKLENAYLAMEADTQNEMTLIVTSYGASSDQDTSLHLKFDGAGAYETLPTPADEAPADEAPKKN